MPKISDEDARDILADLNRVADEDGDVLCRSAARLIRELLAARKVVMDMREVAKDPREDSVCVGDGWDFYTDAVNFARKSITAYDEAAHD